MIFFFSFIFFCVSHLPVSNYSPVALTNKHFRKIVAILRLRKSGVDFQQLAWGEFKLKFALAQKQFEVELTSIEFFNKGKFQRAVKNLVQEGIVDGTPKSIAGFLYEEQRLKRLTKKALGKFILNQLSQW